ncbi:MAG: NAD(P)-dependent oxidoreductase, partial [Patescibacteria group bacterium]
TNKEQLATFDWPKNGLIINAAAYTQVDRSQEPEGRLIAWQVNASAVAELAKITRKCQATLIHFSTDYVFDGQTFPHEEDEPFSPLGVYGQSKAAGDLAALTCDQVYLIRTSWVIGDGGNFVRTMLSLAEKGVSPSVVTDQTGRPTFVQQLVEAVEYLIERGAAWGVYNVSNDGPIISWADLAEAVFSQVRPTIKVQPVTTADYILGRALVAPRPPHGEFNLAKIKSTGLKLRPWRQDLIDYLDLP